MIHSKNDTMVLILTDTKSAISLIDVFDENSTFTGSPCNNQSYRIFKYNLLTEKELPGCCQGIPLEQHLIGTNHVPNFTYK